MSDSYCKSMRGYFRDDENYIGWIESINRALHMENARLEYELKLVKEVKEIFSHGGEEVIHDPEVT